MKRSKTGGSAPLIPRNGARIVMAVVAAMMCVAGLLNLEREKTGVLIEEDRVSGIPVSVYRLPESDGPTVILAHGFSGSRTMMQALAVTFARAGYRAVSLDFPGHGDNPAPMSADFTSPVGATQQLQDVVSAVIDAVWNEADGERSVALIGHSMATDIVVRLALQDRRVGPLVAISMYSAAVTDTAPSRMLAISGEFEPGLREAALDAVRQIDPEAAENEIVSSPDGRVTRGAIVAPGVEHLGVLYSDVTHVAAVEWLDEAFGRHREEPVSPASMGLGVVLVLGGAFLLFWPVAGLVPPKPPPRPIPSTPWLPVLVPSVVTPLALAFVSGQIVPMPGMTYLAAHLGVSGLMTLALLWRAGVRPSIDRWPTALVLLGYGLGVIAILIDRVFTDFVPTPDRLGPIALIALGTVPFMIADSLLIGRHAVPWWFRFLARVLYLCGLAAAVAVIPEERLILAFFAPVLVLHFLVFGTMARWLEARVSAPSATGAALGLLLAYALGSVAPMIGAAVAT